MYYYNEQECILNTETKDTQKDLFIPEGEGYIVDYFDLVCSPTAPETCPQGAAPVGIKHPGVAFDPANDTTVIKTVSGSEVQCRDQ